MWTLSGFADEISPDLDEQCRVLAELGIGYIEFRSAWEINVLDLDDEQLKQVAETLSRYGIRTSSVGSPIGKIGIRDDFDAHLARFDRALHVAEFLEAPFIRIFSFFIPANDTPDAYRDEVLRRMSALVERAQGRPVTLLHENEKEIYGDIPSRCLDLVEAVGSPQLKLAWDAANFVQCGVRPHTEGYEMLRQHVGYIQVKDAMLADGTVVVAGEGDGEIGATIAALREDGFDGFFSMEPHLSAVGQFGGFSGPDLFAKATHAFTGILDAQGITYR
jgi:sugar phosphate isomerase/epimerase